jgi:hypothetical protein
MTTGSAEFGDPRERKLRPWRWLRLLAGLALASAFFMPVLPGCGGPIIPAAECRDAIKDLTSQRELLSSLSILFQGVCVYLATYLIGLLLAVSALAGLAKWRRTGLISDWTIAGLLVIVCCTALSVGMIVFSQNFPKVLGDWIGLVLSGPVATFCLWHTVRAIRLGLARGCAYRALAAALVCGWFWTWFLTGLDVAFYGLYLSVLSSCLLLLSVVQEGRILSGDDLWRTCLGLVLARLRIQDPAGRCLECGYDLRGLTEPRCPECGTSFTPGSEALASRSG